ncbi:MAG: hypothetical protein WED11_02740 [Natronospirillum sp.]
MNAQIRSQGMGVVAPSGGAAADWTSTAEAYREVFVAVPLVEITPVPQPDK